MCRSWDWERRRRPGTGRHGAAGRPTSCRTCCSRVSMNYRGPIGFRSSPHSRGGAKWTSRSFSAHRGKLRAGRFCRRRPSQHGRNLLAALYLSPFWVRAPADFVAKAGMTCGRQIPDLMEHLFAVHPIAPCLRNAWFARSDEEMPDLRWIAWFILAGQGASIQRAGPLFGWRASRALLQHLPSAPADLTPTDGFIWADIKRLRGRRDGTPPSAKSRRIRLFPDLAGPQPAGVARSAAARVRGFPRGHRALAGQTSSRPYG